MKSQSEAGGQTVAPTVTKARPWRVKAFVGNRSALISSIFLLIILAIVIFVPLVFNMDPNRANNFDRYAPIGTEGHILGTDQQGRDMLARLIHGGRISLLIGLAPTLLAGALGLSLGLVAGYVRGFVDQIIMRCLDIMFAFPLLLLAIAIAGALQPGVSTQVIAITVVLIPYFARLARTSTESVIRMPFIEAARAAGGTSSAIMLRYVLPNVFAPVVVYATTLAGMMIVVGSGLSFLGLGAPPPVADWGSMVADGRVALRRAPHVTALPGVAILLVSLAFSFLGDGIRDALDPRSIRR